MAARSQNTDSGPIREHTRITSLDLIRGVAVLGILLMNAVSFKFVEAAYHNISAGGSETWLDWTVGIFGEVFIDQKFMGMFSLLFGAGIILFIDRAAQRGRRAVLLNLWRNIFAAGNRHSPLHALVRRRADDLCAVSLHSDPAAKSAEQGAADDWCGCVHAVRSQRSVRTSPCQCGRTRLVVYGRPRRLRTRHWVIFRGSRTSCAGLGWFSLALHSTAWASRMAASR